MMHPLAQGVILGFMALTAEAVHSNVMRHAECAQDKCFLAVRASVMAGLER
jgi:hypothetical protein